MGLRSSSTYEGFSKLGILKSLLLSILSHGHSRLGWFGDPAMTYERSIYIYMYIPGWWFGTFFILPYIENNDPNWLIFFRGVGQPPTRYIDYIYDPSSTIHPSAIWQFLMIYPVGIHIFRNITCPWNPHWCWLPFGKLT